MPVTPNGGAPRGAVAEAGDGHGHRGTRAVQRLVEYAPSTGGLALWVRHRDRPAEVHAPLVATDGHTVWYGAGFEALPVAVQAGHVAHEVLHVALRHPQRHRGLQQLLGDVDLRLFNTCADAIVNSSLGHLGWLQLPAGAVFLEQLLAAVVDQELGASTALLTWDVERLYRAVDDRRPPPAQGGRRNGGADGEDSGRESRTTREDGPVAARVRALGAGMALDLLPAAGAADAPEDEAEQARAWRERLQRAHAGDGVYSMLRTLLADMPRVRTPWEQVLRTQLARGLSQRPGVSWSRPSRSYIANQGRAGPHRRLPWEPGFGAPKAVPRLALVVDISGSIDDALMARFAREVDAITRRQEAALVLIVGDDRVRRVVHFEPGRSDLGGIDFQGGGGTDFTPLLEEADRQRPDVTLVLTDLEGPADFRPRSPVIWAVPEALAAATVAPFGRVLVLR